MSPVFIADCKSAIFCSDWIMKVLSSSLLSSTLSDEEEHQLIYEVVGKRAKRRTMHLLEQMDRTEQQLREKLKQGGYPQACIDLALEYVKSFHYVDDYRYACTYINYRQDRMSRYQLKVKLYGKGVPGEVIDRALEECYEGDEQEDRKSTRLNSSHPLSSRMQSSA